MMTALMPPVPSSRICRHLLTIGIPKAKDFPDPVPVAMIVLLPFWTARTACDWCLYGVMGSAVRFPASVVKHFGVSG